MPTTMSSHTPLFNPEIIRGHITEGIETPQPEPPPTYGDALVLTWDTRLVATSPPRAVGFYIAGGTADVDWGDGTTSGGVSGTLAHSYPTAGIWTCVITGTVTQFSMQPAAAAQQDRLIRCDKFLSTLTAISFYGSSNLYEVPDSLPSGITSLNSVFRDCGSINDPGISSWNTSNVVGNGFGEAFRGASLFNQPLNSWDVSGATALAGMFQDAVRFNQDLDSWDVSNVTTMATMFGGADRFNSDITTWDTSAVTTMTQMFFSADRFNQPIGDWDVSSVLNFASMFQGAGDINQPLADWIVSQSTAMENMFNGASDFNQNISRWCNPHYTTVGPTGFATSTSGSWTATEKPSFGVCSHYLEMFDYILGPGPLAINGDMIYACGSYFYPSTEAGKFTVIDVSDPDNPVRRGDVIHTSFYLTQNIVNDGAICYITTSWTIEEELIVVDASDPDNPVVIAELEFGSTGTSALAKDGDYLYIGAPNNVGTNFWVVDVSDPTTPTVVFSSNLTGSFQRLYTIVADGDGFAYVGADNTGAIVVDVSTPTAPTVVTTIAPTGGSLVAGGTIGVGGLLKDGDVLWMIRGNDGGLLSVDISTPSTPAYLFRGYVSGVVGGGGSVGGAYLRQVGNGIGIAADGRVAFINNFDPTTPRLYHSDINIGFLNDTRGFVTDGENYWTANGWRAFSSNTSIGSLLNMMPWPPAADLPTTDFATRLFDTGVGVLGAPRNYWPCDEETTPLYDWGTQGLLLVVTGAAAYQSAAISAMTGPSIGLSGTIRAEAASGSVSGVTSFSVGGWFKTTSATSQVMMQQRDAAGFNGEWAIEIDSAGHIHVYAFASGAFEFDFTYTTTNYRDGNAHLVGLVVNQVADRGEIWVDGVQKQTGGNVGGSYDSSLNIALGRDVRDNNKNFVGTLSDWFIDLQIYGTTEWEHLAGID